MAEFACTYVMIQSLYDDPSTGGSPLVPPAHPVARGAGLWGVLWALGLALLPATGCIEDFYFPPIPVECGDGVAKEAEECDDGNTADGDGCSADCQTEPGWSCRETPSVCTTECGDGIRAGAETCDGTDLDGQNCMTLLGASGGDLFCRIDCQAFIVEECHTCGDGDIEGIEVCDGTYLLGATCTSETSLTEGDILCAPDCLTFDTSDCHSCGDDVIQGPEVCDGADLGGVDCDSLPGLRSGTLACTPDCTSLDTAGCLPDCDNTGDCGQCSACAEGAYCLGEADACATSTQCQEFISCVTACGGDPTCQADCATNHAAGFQLYEALALCTFCEACPSDCAGRAACP